MCEWKECKIGDIVTLEYGKGLKDYRDGNGKYDVFGTNGKIGFTNEFLYDRSSVIIGRKGAYREVHLAKQPFFVIDTAFYTKTIIENLDNRFLYYWFKNIDINEMDSGSAIPSTSRDEVYELAILLPPFPEQRAIASILSSLDDKIDLLHRQNKTLEAMADTLFRQWFVEEAEEGWESKISELPIKIIDGDRGKNYPKNKELFNTGDCLFLSAKNVTTNGFNFNQCQFITSEKDSLLRSGKLKRNDIIITTRGTVGNIAYYDNLISFSDVRINSGMIILRTDPSVLDPIFVFCLISSNYFMYLIENQTSGSAQPQMPIRDFKQIEVLVPPKEKIDDFLTFAKPCLNKKFNNDSQIRTLEKLRDTLLPKLMNGEVRVQLAQGEAAI